MTSTPHLCMSFGERSQRMVICGQVNVTAALPARTLNLTIRLVIRMYNRERGEHLERLLDRAVSALGPARRDGARHVHHSAVRH
ncbi:hypothetical protein [Streptomyces sirii]|uniref:hypothetical protein n=1 Tax=Streptomyces sirii TaxID=3127701 RepID=UPI003D35D786